MASTISAFDTRHDDMIHDAQLDYYGRRLATCSSDRTVKLFDVTGDKQTQIADLRGHEGPVWRVAWAHPKFGSILASCSYDRTVFVWKETSENAWSKIYQYGTHVSSVNAVSWCPHEQGLCLATASSDGSFATLTHRDDDTWEVHVRQGAHAIGCNAVSWAPAVEPAALLENVADVRPVKRLATGGCDHKVRVWRFVDSQWVEETALSHLDWVRDVAWAPSSGLLPRDMIASCSQDGAVYVWVREDGGEWTQRQVCKLDVTAWRVSWSIAGNILAVSAGDNRVTLWKENAAGAWECVSSLDDTSAGPAAAAASAVPASSSS